MRANSRVIVLLTFFKFFYFLLLLKGSRGDGEIEDFSSICRFALRALQ